MKQLCSKGQYRIISELVLFGLGIMITSYVIVNFNGVQDTVKGLTTRDQLEAVTDSVAAAIVQAATTANSTVRLKIPDRVSDSTYRISIKDADGGKIVVHTLDGRTVVERQIFNINYDNMDSSNNVINNSEVLSTAQYVEIVKNEKITVRRTAT